MLLFAVSCEKEDIRPNFVSSTPEQTKSGISDSTNVDGTLDPNTDDGGGITDPIRKKDKRDK